MNGNVRIFRSIMGMLLTFVLASQNQVFLDASALTGNQQYMAIKANEQNLSNKTVVNGFTEGLDSSDYASAFYYLLGDNCSVEDSLNINGNFMLSEETYSKTEVSVNAENCILEKPISAQGNINLNCTKVESSSCIFIYSEEGDININCDTLNFNGILCAPKGSIVINAKNVSIQGSIITKKTTVNADKAEVAPTKRSNKIYEFISSYINEGYMCCDAYEENGELVVYCEPNLKIAIGTVYLRYAEESSFSKFGEFEGNEGRLPGFSFDTSVDIIVEGETKFGEEIKADLITLAKNESGENYCAFIDTDNDGIRDGLEIYYLNTNPKLTDTDNDGVPDGAEIFNYYTDPAVFNNHSLDFDHDGVKNIDEYINKTNPYLMDTDFDGKKDGLDLEAVSYTKNSEAKNIPSTAKGKFDIIMTEINEDGTTTQMLFDFINGHVRLERTGDVIISYQYNYDQKLASKITSCNGEINTTSYEYFDDNIIAIYNNGYKYGFNYNENDSLVSVTLNDKEFISVADAYGNNYDYSYDEKQRTVSYNYKDTGMNVIYSLDENGGIKSIETNRGFNISYNNINLDNGIEYYVSYSLGNETGTRTYKTTYTEEGSRVTNTILESGTTISSYMESEDTKVVSLKTKNKNFFKRVTYGINGLPIKIRQNDGITETYSYDSLEELTKYEENDILVSEYEYDDQNHLVMSVNTKMGIANTYEYDLNDNIRSVRTYSYVNNELGNLMFEDVYSYSNDYKDQLVSFNGKQITYNENGKPIKYYDGSSFAWTGNKLTNISNNGNVINLYYDANGILSKKIVNGVETTYFIKGYDYIAETTNGKTIKYLYDASAEVIGFTYEGQDYYYVKNALGDIVRIMDGYNQFVCGYTYDAYGDVLMITGDTDLAKMNKFRYRSYYYDTDLGFYNLKSRFYDPTVKRFLSTDKANMLLFSKNNLNLYAYCNGNPVRYTDPEGEINVAVIGLDYWASENAKILEEFQDYYGAKNVYGKKYNIEYADDIEDIWNSLSGYKTVLINTHANPIRLSDNKGSEDRNKLTEDEIEGLKYKATDTLILLGCSAGRWGTANVAYFFSRKIRGVVVASDDTVTSSWSGFNKFLYNDIKWTSDGDVGWILSYYSASAGIAQKMGMKTVTIKTILDYIRDNNVLSGNYK